MGSGPLRPCQPASPSGSDSKRRKLSSIASHRHSGNPHESKSAGMARTAMPPFTAELPPSTQPRG